MRVGEGDVGGGEHEFLNRIFFSAVRRVGKKNEKEIEYAVARLDAAIPDRFHHAALFIRYIAHPVRLPSRHEHVRRPPVHMPV